MYERFFEIKTAKASELCGGQSIGKSRQGRPIQGFKFGAGKLNLSLIAGNHADEPVGPRFLGLLTAYLSTLPDSDPLLNEYSWWIVPHSNPDGRENNHSWQKELKDKCDLGLYLRDTRRELPGDDMEFGFPRSPDDSTARPENVAIANWWQKSGGFDFHASLHGMGFAAGPWFLIDSEWSGRCGVIRQRCSEAVERLGYKLHDVERHGEKGFQRISKGFCTRPNHRAMQTYFKEQGDEETAAKFRPSSMEYVRKLGRDTLTIVSEMPLFILPDVGKDLGPPDPAAEEWRSRIVRWKDRLEQGERPELVSVEAEKLGLLPMPIEDQMHLQWTFICSAIEQLKA